MLKRILAGVLVALVMVPAIAAAETAGGIYLGSRIGWSSLQDGGISGDLVSLNAKYKDGYAVMGAVGYAHSSGLRFELEGGYRSNDLEQITATAIGTGGPPLPVGVPLAAIGEMQSANVMANAYYDFDLGLPVSPFVGGGLGIGVLYVNATVPSIGSEVLADVDLVFSYQGTAGVSLQLSSWVVVDLAYTYFMTEAADYGNLPINAVESEYKSHSAMAGLRLFF